jgi:integrase
MFGMDVKRKAIQFKKIEKTTEPQPLSYTETIDKLRQYLLFDRRLAPYNAANIVKAVKSLIKRYKSLNPSVELARRIETDMIEKGRSRNTIRLYLYSIEAWGASQGKTFELSKPKITQRRVKYLSRDEVNRAISACRDIKELTVLLTLLHTGIRNKELINLNVEDVDLTNRLLYIRDRGEGIKTFQENTSVLSIDAKKALAEYLECRPVVDTPALFYNKFGKRLTQRVLDRMLQQIGKRAGVHLYPHLCRHTLGTFMAANSISLPLIQRQLRQRNVQSTMIYVHADEGTIKQNLDRVLLY